VEYTSWCLNWGRSQRTLLHGSLIEVYEVNGLMILDFPFERFCKALTPKSLLRAYGFVDIVGLLHEQGHMMVFRFGTSAQILRLR